MKRRFHASGQDHNDWRRRVRDYRESFPHHEGCGEYEGKVEGLGENLARLHGAEGKHLGGYRAAIKGRSMEDGGRLVEVHNALLVAYHGLGLQLSDAPSKGDVSEARGISG